VSVLIGQGYYLRFDPKLRRAAQPYPPLGALYAAAVLRQDGHDVRVFDAMLADGEADWGRCLDEKRPALAVLYEDSFNYLSKMCLGRMREASHRMIRMARERGVVVLAAGSDASDHAAEYLRAGARAVIVGEGEATLAEAVNVLLRDPGAPLDGVAGLALAGDGLRERRTPGRPLLRDLDSLPRPAFDLVDVAEYRRIWRSRHGYHSMNLVTTRGCPYHCNWCAKPIYGQRYAVRSAESMAEEIAWLKATYAPDHIAFMDDIFGLKPGWVERFADAVEAKDAVVPFKCLSRADLLTPEVLRALRRAGCRTVWIGAESGSQRILDAMEKGITIGEIESATREAKRVGIEVGFFLQFGYPGETLADVEATRALVKRCAPDDIGISVSYPLPGTPFFDRVRHELRRKQNWVDSADLAMMYEGPFRTGFYRALHDLVHAEFRLGRLARRPGQSLRARAARLRYAGALPLHRMRVEWWARQPHRALDVTAGRLSPEAARRPTPEEA